MSSMPSRSVVAPAAPPMTDEDFQTELGRHTAFLADLKTPGRRRKASQHPDIARAVVSVQAAYGSARDRFGTNDPESYFQALIAVRQAIGAWQAVDAQHGEVTWRGAGG